MSQQDLQYDGFLSYSHKDARIVEKLSRRIRNYVPPRKAAVDRRKLKIFRDEERLTVTAHLPDKLKQVLLDSKWLILICSPNAAVSEWVNSEVQTFLEHKKEDSIIFVLCEGEFGSSLPHSLNGYKNHPLYIDLRGAGRKKFRKESLQLIAGLYEVDFAVLMREDEARRRRLTRRLVFASAVFIFLLASIYLISSVQPVYWKRIQEPGEYGPASPAPILPIHEIAIYKQDPSRILYLEENAEWPGDGPMYSIIPGNIPKEFDAMALSRVKRSQTVTPLARIDLMITDMNGASIGQGRMMIWGAMGSAGDARYIRSIIYKGTDTAKKSVTITIPPVALDKNENPFDIGRLADTLVQLQMLDYRGKVAGVLSTLYDNKRTELSYDLESDELMADGFSTKESFYGNKYYIESNGPETDLKVLGVPMETVRYDSSFWNKISVSGRWLTYKEPMVGKSASGFSESRDRNILAHKICKELTDPPNPGNLEKSLAAMDIQWDEDNLDFTLYTAATNIGRMELLKVTGEHYPQHQKPEVTFVQWLMRRSPGADWKPELLPSDDPKGIWPLDSLGQASLLLTNDKGFFLTHNGGGTWEPANYNVSELSEGEYIKAYVTDKDAIYALVDRGNSSTDMENPLYRLEKRNLWERWRTGLIQWLQ